MKRLRSFRRFLTASALLALAGAAVMAESTQPLFPPGEASLILYNGRIYTLDGAHGDDPGRVVEAAAVQGDRIAALGTNETVVRWLGRRTRMLDLHGAMVVPGLTDAHMHLAGLGRTRRMLDLVGTENLAAIQARLRRYAAEHPQARVLRGRGWDQNDWPTKRMPTHEDLDVVESDRPVVLTRIDGHALWVNRKALELAGIGKETPDPEGGRILRDRHGNPTGVLVDNAMDLVRRVLPAPTPEEIERDLRAGMEACLAVGLTEVHDAGIGYDTWQAYHRLGRQGALSIRVYAMASAEDELFQTLLRNGPVIGLYGGRLTLRAVKAFADGALGSRGAALLAPYRDDPGQTGLLMITPDEFSAFARRVRAAGLQLNTHAIGDRANREVLHAYAKAFGSGGCRACRFRIEHAQILAPEDLPLFHRLGVVPSMQPTHATSDMPWAPDRLGPERLKGAYAWRSLLDDGNVIAGGSDAPVESIDPRLGLYAAVTRQDLSGRPEGGWLPEQRVRPVEALLMFTRWAAYAAFEEHLRGTLRPGMLADFTVFARDLLRIPPREWPHVPVLYTIVGGIVEYPRETAKPATGSR